MIEKNVSNCTFLHLIENTSQFYPFRTKDSFNTRWLSSNDVDIVLSTVIAISMNLPQIRLPTDFFSQNLKNCSFLSYIRDFKNNKNLNSFNNTIFIQMNVYYYFMEYPLIVY